MKICRERIPHGHENDAYNKKCYCILPVLPTNLDDYMDFLCNKILESYHDLENQVNKNTLASSQIINRHRQTYCSYLYALLELPHYSTI